MKAVLDELTEFTDSYVEDDFLQKKDDNYEQHYKRRYIRKNNL